MKICGILIIIAGLSVILYGSFFYTPLNQAPDMGLIQVDESNNQAVRIPPIMGIAGHHGGRRADLLRKEAARIV